MGKRIILLWLIVLPGLAISDTLGDYFFNRGHYFEAITEYKRDAFFNGVSDEVLFKWAKALEKCGERDVAAEKIIQAASNAEISPTDRNCLILLSKIYWDSYDYESMRRTLDCLSSDMSDEQKEDILYVKAWTFFYEAKWDTGIVCLEGVQRTELKSLQQEISTVKNTPQKSKKIALTSSRIVPGTGNIYVGDYQNGAYSFLLVGSTMASIVLDLFDGAFWVAGIKYFFIYSRYSQGSIKKLARQVDQQNIDAIGNSLKVISDKYPKPMEVLLKMENRTTGVTSSIQAF